MPAGRPSDYNEDIARTICDLLAEGASLREVCRMDGMPGRTAVFNWLAKHKEFAGQYARAKQEGMEAWADEIIDIADTGKNDWMERNDSDNPGYAANGEHIQRSRLRIDTRKWLLSKLAPKKYGDKLALGSDEESPLVIQVVRHGDDE